MLIYWFIMCMAQTDCIDFEQMFKRQQPTLIYIWMQDNSSLIFYKKYFILSNLNMKNLWKQNKKAYKLFENSNKVLSYLF